MSYDIYLKDPVTKDVCQVKGHLMTGGTYKADYDELTGTFYPALNTDAHMNISYNYAKYYYEATSGDVRFAHSNDGAVEYGIRGLYGKTGAESLAMLSDMITRIRARYHDGETWANDTREREYWVDTQGERHDFSEVLEIYFLSLNHPDEAPSDFELWEKRTETYLVNEGNTNDYWEPTAANAIRPLHQLMALAQMRPDGVWDGD